MKRIFKESILWKLESYMISSLCMTRNRSIHQLYEIIIRLHCTNNAQRGRQLGRRGWVGQRNKAGHAIIIPNFTSRLLRWHFEILISWVKIEKYGENTGGCYSMDQISKCCICEWKEHISEILLDELSHWCVEKYYHVKESSVVPFVWVLEYFDDITWKWSVTRLRIMATNTHLRV